jgi:hypothetical protein
MHGSSCLEASGSHLPHRTTIVSDLGNHVCDRALVDLSFDVSPCGVWAEVEGRHRPVGGGGLVLTGDRREEEEVGGETHFHLS